MRLITTNRGSRTATFYTTAEFDSIFWAVAELWVAQVASVLGWTRDTVRKRLQFGITNKAMSDSLRGDPIGKIRDRIKTSLVAEGKRTDRTDEESAALITSYTRLDEASDDDLRSWHDTLFGASAGGEYATKTIPPSRAQVIAHLREVLTELEEAETKPAKKAG
jgi:hypothetical protein